MFSIKGPVGIISPLVWMGGTPDDRILMEIQQIFILEDSQIGVTDVVQLKTALVNSSWGIGNIGTSKKGQRMEPEERHLRRYR